MGTLLTVSNYYDGPLEGVCLFKKKPYYYQRLPMPDPYDMRRIGKDEDGDDAYEFGPWYFAVWPMPEDIYKLAMEQWQLWRRWRMPRIFALTPQPTYDKVLT